MSLEELTETNGKTQFRKKDSFHKTQNPKSKKRRQRIKKSKKSKKEKETCPQIESIIYQNEYCDLMYYPNLNTQKEQLNYTNENSEIISNNYKTKYKTEKCRYWEMYGQCQFGENCAFAHGDSELKKRKFTFNYKTKPCKQFFELGYCSYGIRCQFSHKKSDYIQNEINENDDNISYLKILNEFLSANSIISHELVKRPRLSTFENITKSTVEESQNSKLKLYEDIISLKKGNNLNKLSEETNYTNISSSIDDEKNSIES